MGVLDFLTGGKSGEATDAMRRAQEMFANVRSPSAADLTLPELQKYVQAGVLTPAQAQAVLNKQNAYDTTAVPTEGRNAQIAALNQLQDIASAKGMDPTAQAQTQQTLNALNTNMQGQRGAILDSFAQRGVPLSLASEAMQNTVLGQDAQAANANALQANADAQMRALQALQGSANVGANVQGQDWNQANTKAAAANAINQWNSQVANTVAENNAARQQQANAYNTGVKQDVSNQNVGQGNYRTEYNARVPQQVFSNAMQKAGGQANAYQNMANLANQQGQQQYGMFKDIASGASAFFPTGGGGGATSQAPGGSKGGMVPGKAQVPGDSPANDTVPARLSPGELVVPRSLVNEFVGNLPKKHGSAHPDDVKSVLKALSDLRNKEIEPDDGGWTGGCAKGMAAGGMVEKPTYDRIGDNIDRVVADAFVPERPKWSFDNQKLMGDLTPGSSSQNPISDPIVSASPLNIPETTKSAQNAPILSRDVANIAPKPSVAANVAPQAPDNANPMADYLAGLRSKVSEFGPDKQKETLDYLTRKQGGLGNRIGQALANFGGTGAQYSDANQRALENAMKIGKDYNEGKLGQLESGMKIDMMSPTSAVSRQLQQTYGPLFDKLGYPKGTVEKMAASDIKSALAMAIESGGKETENMIKAFEAQANIDLRRQGLAAGTAEASQKAGLEEAKMKQAAASELLKRGNTKVWGVPIPFTGPSGKETEAAKNVLMENIGAGAGAMEERKTADGKIALFDRKTKEFKGYK